MTIKSITKVRFGWVVEIIRNGEVVRRFECRDLTEARRCEQGLTRKPSPSRLHSSPDYSTPAFDTTVFQKDEIMITKRQLDIAYKAGLEAGITDYESEVRQGSRNLNPFKNGSDESQHFMMGYIDGFTK